MNSICILGSHFGTSQSQVTVTLKPKTPTLTRNIRSSERIHFNSTVDEFKYLEELFRNHSEDKIRNKREIKEFSSYENEEHYLEELVFKHRQDNDGPTLNFDATSKRSIPSHQEITDDEYEFITDLFLEATNNKKIKRTHNFLGLSRKRRALLGGSGSNEDLDSLVCINKH